MELSENIRTTRIDVAGRMLRSAARMVRLLELGAPGIVIENERRILRDALAEFPVVTEDQLEAERIKLLSRADEERFLREHGYYDDHA